MKYTKLENFNDALWQVYHIYWQAYCEGLHQKDTEMYRLQYNLRNGIL